MGVSSYVSEFCERLHHNTKNLKKRKPLRTVVIKVRIDCEGCERRVRMSVAGMKGVTQIKVEPKLHKLTVTGYVDPDKVLYRVRQRTGKRAEFWPYVLPTWWLNLTRREFMTRKAPPGYVWEDPQTSGMPSASAATEVKYITAFSDDNPNACIVL